MTAKVFFLNKHLNPSEKEIAENKKIQERLEQLKVEFEYRIRDLNPYQKAMSRERAHNLLRGKMRIIKSES